MSTLRSIRVYEGRGESVTSRQVELPRFDVDTGLFDPKNYLPDEKLQDAVNVAISLGMPLLLTGEPGTGKTQLAYSIAWELELGEPEVFYTKSTSVYTDLFYRYDALRHFQSVQIAGAKSSKSESQALTSVDDFITFGPLGRAILHAMDRSDPACPNEFRATEQRRSVVLVDELDKAPRDFPNDILNEVERMIFEIKELPLNRNTFRADPAFRPILILTSNVEKDLPEAFRRRCVFYHINFKDLDVRTIISRRLPNVPQFTEQMLENALAHFSQIREKQGLDKLPATAELIAWVSLLQRLRLDVKSVKELTHEDRLALIASYSILAKSDEDLKKLTSFAANPGANTSRP